MSKGTILMRRGDILRMYKRLAVGKGRATKWQMSWVLYPKGKASVPDSMDIVDANTRLEVVDKRGVVAGYIHPHGNDKDVWIDYILDNKNKLKVKE